MKTIKKSIMKKGWYVSNGEGWYWNGRSFTDHVNKVGYQYSCIKRELRDWDVKSYEEMLEKASLQARNPFTCLDGPMDFDEMMGKLGLL